MDEQIKKNISAASIWIRLVYMLFFALVIYISMCVLAVVVLVQFIIVLITGKPNIKLLSFSDVLSQYLFSSFNFVCFITEEKPFPFDDFPESRFTDSGDSSEDKETDTSSADADTSDAGGDEEEKKQNLDEEVSTNKASAD